MWGDRAGTRPIRVLIADDHDVARRRLRAQLSAASDVEVVSEADDGALALRLAHWLQPDVALLDERLPEIGGLDLARVFAAQLPEVRVVILTGGASAVADVPADVPAG